MSVTREFVRAPLEEILGSFPLRESGSPHLTLHSPMGPAPVGQVRVWKSDAPSRPGPIDKVIQISLSVPPIGLESHTLFAFTPAASAAPHFTVEAVSAGPARVAHLDLFPRLDLGTNLAYLDAAFEPLTAAFHAAGQVPGCTAAQLQPRQRAVMSPWNIALHADEAALAALSGVVKSYLDHWKSMVQHELPAEATQGLSADALATRDRMNRALIFSPAVDPVWARIERLLGAEQCEQLLNLLR